MTPVQSGIGGRNDWSALSAAMPVTDLVRGARDRSREVAATMHRPTDQASLRAEAQRLASLGLRARDIASALGLSDVAAAELLESLPIASGEVQT